MLHCRVGEGPGWRLHFDLPLTEKVLLLAAYVCSSMTLVHLNANLQGGRGGGPAAAL